MTFADRMALLMSFFVILAAYSTQGRRTTPLRRDQSSEFGLTETGEPDHVGLAAASLRQALQDIAELSKNVVIVRSEQDPDPPIVDQDGRSMFPDGSTRPNERTWELSGGPGAQRAGDPGRRRAAGRPVRLGLRHPIARPSAESR